MVLRTPQLEQKLSGTVHVPQATQCTLTEGLVCTCSLSFAKFNESMTPIFFGPDKYVRDVLTWAMSG